MDSGPTRIAELDPRMAPLEPNKTTLAWATPDRAPFRLSGFPWYPVDAVYRRLPVKPRWPLPEAVDRLADSTAGGQVAFRSDSTLLAVRVVLAGPADMNHMPATGQCGFDLYVGEPGGQRFHAVTKYDHRETEYTVQLFSHAEVAVREFTLNFPLYQGVKRVEIGLQPGAEIAAPTPWSEAGRIVVYGTSITQGGCACRPGMAYTNILSRALGMEIVNLGFSGNGKGEPDVIRTVAQIDDVRLFVLDYEANAGGRLKETLPAALRILRELQPAVPVVVVSRILPARCATHADARARHDASRDMQARVVAEAADAGPVAFIDGCDLLGEDYDECTVDGSHPTDLGFMRMARALEPRIRRLL